MQLRPHLNLAIALVAGTCTISTASADLITNGSFEDGSYSFTSGYEELNAGSTDITGWTVVDYPIYAVDTPLSGLTAENGNVYLQLNSFPDTSGPYGGVAQQVATTAGQLYTLSFWIGDYPNSSDGVSIAANIGGTIQDGTVVGGSSETFTENNTTGWTYASETFMATGSSTLIALIGNHANNYTVGLDNVSLTHVNATPEPFTGSLAIAGIGLAVRRRIARKTSFTTQPG